jgi:hypothetical protein
VVSKTEIKFCIYNSIYFALLVHRQESYTSIVIVNNLILSYFLKYPRFEWPIFGIISLSYNI